MGQPQPSFDTATKAPDFQRGLRTPRQARRAGCETVAARPPQPPQL